MRTRIAVIIGTCLVAQLVLASTPASAGSRIRAREVVGGLNQPVAFTFGPGRKIWYVEKGTGRVRIHDLDTDADRLFVKVPGVNGDGERGMLGIALHPSYPAKPLVYVYATRSADGRLSNQILRYRDDHGSGVNRTVLFTSAAGGSPYHNGGRIAFGPDGMLYAIVGDAHDSSNAQDTNRRGPRQDHPHRPRRPRPERQPVRRPGVGVRDPELVRLRVRSADRRPVGDRERAVVQRRDQPDPGRRELRLGAERDLRRRLPPATRTRTDRARSCPSSSTRARSASPASRSATVATSAGGAPARRSSER